MSQAIKLTAFVLLIIGTVGLLVNELVADWGRATTLTFAVFNFAGLAVLAATHFGRKGDR